MFPSDTPSKPKVQRLRAGPIFIGGLVTAIAFTVGLDVVTGSLAGGAAYIAAEVIGRRKAAGHIASN